MDSCSVTMKANVCRMHVNSKLSNGDNVYWGEKIRYNLKKKVFGNLVWKNSIRSQNKAEKINVGEAAFSLLTTKDINEQIDKLEELYIGKESVDPKKVAAIVLGYSAGTRLLPLTDVIAKPAIPIGGFCKLIDVPMNNCLNSGIQKIFALTQYNSLSLNSHLTRTYCPGNSRNGFVEILAATQTTGEEGKKWFQGTADAVRQFAWVLKDEKKIKDIKNIVILPGDHLYRMDYMELVQTHMDTNADITVSCVPMDESRASDYGLVKVDERGRIIEFSEKPKGSALKAMHDNTSFSPKQKPYLASMGVYVFKTELLSRLLRTEYPKCNDFGSEILPLARETYNIQAHIFRDHWDDIGDVKGFYEANLAVTEHPSKFDFNHPEKPFYALPSNLPPTKIENCRVQQSIISHGCFLKDCSIQHSVVGERSRLESGVELKDTVMVGADEYKTDYELMIESEQERVPIGVGRNTKIRKCIIDTNARIGKNVVILNKDGVEESDRPEEGFCIRSGIVVIRKNATIPDGKII